MARPRGSKFQADVRTPEGKRLRPAFDTMAEAQAWEAAAILALEQGKPIPPHATAGRVGNRDLSTLGSAFEHVKKHHWSNLKAGEDLIRNGKYAVDYFGAHRKLTDISTADIAVYRTHWLGLGNAPATVNRKTVALTKIMRTAQDAGVVGVKVPKVNLFKEEQTRFRYLDDKEERLMTAYWEDQGDEEQRDLCTVLIDTGARPFKELIPAKWDAFGPATVTFWHTKTGKPRTVPLTKRAQEIIKRRRATYGSTHAGPFTMVKKTTMRDRWKKLRTVCEWDDVTPYTLRHTCCTRLVLAGVDIKRVMTWMGHDNITTTMRYMQIKPTALEELIHLLERKIA